MKKVSIIGAGKVGLCVAVHLTNLGHNVKVYDNYKPLLEKLARKENPLEWEPGVNLDKITVCSTLADAVNDVECVFIVVPTPTKDTCLSGAPVAQVLDEIEAVLETGTVVCVVSTLDPRDAKEVMKPRRNMALVYSPCMIKLGSVIKDLENASVLFLGNDTGKSDACRCVRDCWYPNGVPSQVDVIRGSITTIAMAKFATNFALSWKIGLANNIAAKCDHIGADKNTVLRAVGSDPRINSLYLKHGNSPGGPCIYRDGIAFATLPGGATEMDHALVKWHADTHDNLVSQAYKWARSKHTKKVAILGVAYNPKGLDTTNSIGLSVARALSTTSVPSVNVFDPASKWLLKQEDEKFKIVNTIADAVQDADVVIIGTMWDEIKEWYNKNDSGKVLVLDWRK